MISVYERTLCTLRRKKQEGCDALPNLFVYDNDHAFLGTSHSHCCAHHQA